MPSSFTWLDYSEFERRRMLDVIDRFGEKSTVDELGLGSVRDAFADTLFPGTSTIQTRAKYFLFVPWVYQSLEYKHVSSEKFKHRARKLEVSLIYSLMKSSKTSDDGSGLIGRQSKEKLQRLPSGVYWQGLHRWGIRKFDGSEAEYRRSIDNFYAICRAYKQTSGEFEGETRDDAHPSNWDASMPAIPNGFPDEQTLSLNAQEANYLREQLMTCCRGSMLAFLVNRGESVSDITWAWDLIDEVNDNLRQILYHGQNFSEVMHGAQLLYNLMLAELTRSEDWIAGYQAELEEWWNNIAPRKAELINWNVTEFWSFVYRINPRLRSDAKSFVDEWISLFSSADSVHFLDHKATRNSIEARELQLKHGLARLTNERALELWKGRAGADQLDLRWGSSKTILTDILDGLGVNSPRNEVVNA